MDEYEFILCDCKHPEHIIQLSYDDEVNFIYLAVKLNPHKGFFRRLIHAIKYIFGYNSRYGAFDEFVINKESSEQIKQVLNKIKTDEYLAKSALEIVSYLYPTAVEEIKLKYAAAILKQFKPYEVSRFLIRMKQINRSDPDLTIKKAKKALKFSNLTHPNDPELQLLQSLDLMDLPESKIEEQINKLNQKTEE